jgi:hypothetical protein
MVLGLVGGLAVIAGIAAPLMHIPVAGTISYLRHPSYIGGDYWEGVAVLAVMGIVAIAATLARSYRWLWLAGLGSMAQVAATVIGFERSAGAIEAQANQDALVDPIVMFADSAMRHAKFEWGIGVIAGGALLLLTAAIIKPKGSAQQKPVPAEGYAARR